MDKFLSRLALTLGFFLAVTLNSVPQGLTIVPTSGINQLTNLKQANTVSASRYIVSGDRQGLVTVKDAVTGEVVHTFQMDSGVVVRETFLLDNGRTVAASQKDHAVFWDLATGREIGRIDQRVYGFSHDQTRFFTYGGYEQRIVSLYVYPDLKRICQLGRPPSGPDAFHFSPNSSFLAIAFSSGRPSYDEYYPNPNPTISGIYYIRLFNIQTCEEIQKFTELDPKKLGEFSSESRFYDLKDTPVYINQRRVQGSWRLDLTTYEVRELP